MIKVMWISEFFYGAPVLGKSVTELAEPMYCMLHLLQWTYPVGTNIERLSIMFTSNGKREFVPRDQFSPLLAVYC